MFVNFYIECIMFNVYMFDEHRVPKSENIFGKRDDLNTK